MVLYVLPSGGSVEVKEYRDSSGHSPFDKWYSQQEATARAKISTALNRLRGGNFSNVKSVRGGVFEYRINFGPGYRIYFGREGDRIVLLLAGGTKARQAKDISAAQARWQTHKESRTKDN